MTTDDSADDLSQGLPAGTVLSDTYEIVKQIGLGGMAEVYRARNIHTDEPVAIKVVLPEFARDQTNLSLFRKEATVLSRLHHDAIVRYHTFTIEKSMKRPYLVMEFVDGIALSDYIKKGPLNAADTRVLISRVASGLQAAHDVEVIHRDLSPDNVILPEGKVSRTKIVDFGIAKAGKIGEGTLLGGKFAGKYNFVSPEQLGLAGGDVTGQSDIYSLGLIAAAAQLGHPLDMSGSQLDVLEKRRVVPDLSGLDPSIQPIVAAMLQPLPANRPRTMSEVIAMLESPPPAASGSSSRPLTDTGTVFGAEMPYVAPRAADPWSEGAPSARNMPGPSQGTGQGSWPTERSQPPQAWPPAADRSQPPQAWSPPAERSQPPQAWPPAAPAETSYGTRDPGFAGQASGTGIGAPPFESPPSSTSGRSESPFGPGPSTAPPTFGKPRTDRPKQKKGGAGGLIAVLAVLVVLVGGGAFFFLQGGFGLLGGGTPGTVTPTTTPTLTTATVPTVTPTTVATVEVTPSVATTTKVAVTPTTVTPTTAPPPTTTAVTPTTATTTDVAISTPPVTPLPTPPTPGLDPVAKEVAWVRDYDLESCQFAAPIAVAANTMTIEAFGTGGQPFEKMASDFQKAYNFEPDVQVRPIVDPQCAAADFLKAVQPLSTPGPKLALTTDELPSGGSLAGTISDTEGWTTDLLLVDYRGGVQNVSLFMTVTGTGQTFALPPLTSKTTEPVPLILVAISSKGGLNTTRLIRTHEAQQIFPVILQEIVSKGSGVSVSAKYFRLAGTTTP